MYEVINHGVKASLFNTIAVITAVLVAVGAYIFYIYLLKIKNID